MIRGLDLKTLFLVLAIGSISLLVIFSINRSLFYNQLIFWIIGLTVFYLASNFNLQIWEDLAKPFYFFTLLLLIAIFIIAEPVRGSVRWLDLGIFRIQPSEISKVAAVLILAVFFSSHSAAFVRNILLSFMIIAPFAFLVFIQPDIGNSLSFIGIWAGITFASGFRIKQFLIICIIAAVLGIIIFQFLEPYQKARITAYINPSQDRLGTGYQIIQSKIAIGSGQLLGKGLGQATQSQLKFLPEAESDFIFSSISESLGLVGSGLLLVLYAFLIVRVLGFAYTGSRLAQLVVAGTVSFFCIQILINVGMNLGLLPVTGITLPLVSYGGSSLITTLFLLGIVFSTGRTGLDAFKNR